MANGSSINPRTSFEERNFDLSDGNNDDDMESMQRRDFKSMHFKNKCYNAAKCMHTCKSQDGAKGGRCSGWAGECQCHH
jgi:hypothetical protein